MRTITCGNPGRNPDVLGQRKEFTVTGTQTDIDVKNSRPFFNVLTAEPVADPAEVCPNRRWTATVTDAEFTSAAIAVIKPSGSGNVLLQQTSPL